MSRDFVSDEMKICFNDSHTEIGHDGFSVLRSNSNSNLAYKLRRESHSYAGFGAYERNAPAFGYIGGSE